MRAAQQDRAGDKEDESTRADALQKANRFVAEPSNSAGMRGNQDAEYAGIQRRKSIKPYLHTSQTGMFNHGGRSKSTVEDTYTLLLETTKILTRFPSNRYANAMIQKLLSSPH